MYRVSGFSGRYSSRIGSVLRWDAPAWETLGLVDTMVGDELLSVTVWFGTNTPSYDMYEEANAQLSRLVMPELP